jgi:hypothetical protein
MKVNSRFFAALFVAFLYPSILIAADMAPGPIKPKTAKLFTYPDFYINFPGNSAGSLIKNLALTVDQDPNDSNRTIWALSFDTYNANQDVEYAFQGVLFTHL